MASVQPQLRLRPLGVDDRTDALAAHRQMQAEDGFSFLLGYDDVEPPDWADFVNRSAALARGLNVGDGWVPATYLVAVVDGEIVGRSSIRHILGTEELRRESGHIGYGVLAAHRRRGYATEILRQSLVVARSLGVDRALVTCDDDNAGSATVIERCGGVYESTITTTTGVDRRRYWID